MEQTIDLTEKINKVFQPLYYNEDRILLMVGSAGSGKTIFGVQKTLIRALYEPGHKFLVVRKVARTLKSSIWSEFKNMISTWKLPDFVPVSVNRSDYTIRVGDSQLVFVGMDDPEKIKSIQGITGVLIEEATELEADDFDQINLRLRGNTTTYKQIIALFNPISEDHWLKRRYFDQSVPHVHIHQSNFLTNQFIDDEYKQILEGYKETNPLYYQVYCLGVWGVQDRAGKFLWAFDRDKHISTNIYLIDQLPVKLTFDFNIEPFTVSVYQRIDARTLHFLDKIRLNDSDIYQVCDRIKAMYGNRILVVTGDASGKNLTGTVRGKTSYWRIIRAELRLPEAQIRLRRKNIDLINSRVICNAALKTQKIRIHPRCKELVDDCTYATVDETGMLVKDRAKHKNDFLDGFRYAIDSEFAHTMKAHR